MEPFLQYAIGWTALFFILTGWGLLIKRICRIKNLVPDDVFGSFWIGCAGSIFFLQIGHLFFPVNALFFFILSALGLAGLIWERIFFRSCLSAFLRGTLAVPHYFIALAFLGLWAINHALIPIGIYDDGLYYIPLVRWLQEFPIVLGLGNLHGRLACNNSIFLLFAAFEHLFPFSSEFKPNSLFFMMLAAQSFRAAFKLFRNDVSLNVRDIVVALSMPFVTYIYMIDFTGGDLAPDFTVLVLGVILSSEVLLFIERLNAQNDAVSPQLFIITALAALGITIKLSFAPLGGACMAAAFGSWLFLKKKPWTRADTRLCILLVLIGAAGLIPWMVRSVLLSGYAAYPLSLLAFPVDWRIPRASVERLREGIIGYARIDGPAWALSLARWDWIMPWLNKILSTWTFEVIGFLTLSLGGAGLLLKRRIIDKKPAGLSAPVVSFLLLVAFSCVFWLITAPAFRFGEVNLLILSVTTFWLGVRHARRPSRMITGCLIYLLLLLFCFHAEQYRRGFVASSFLSFDYGRISYTGHKKSTTRSGLILNVPTKNNQCWDISLPCTPYPHPDLSLRVAGHMARGFKVSPFMEEDETVGCPREPGARQD